MSGKPAVPALRETRKYTEAALEEKAKAAFFSRQTA
jgi:hypothetical protein